MAPANDPTKLYAEKIAVRWRSSTVCGRIACSSAKNGPTSLPDGLMVPKTAAIDSHSGLLLSANTQPADAIRRAPMIRSALRPKLSATDVMMIVISAPPARAAVNIQPIAAGLTPTASR